MSTANASIASSPYTPSISDAERIEGECALAYETEVILARCRAAQAAQWYLLLPEDDSQLYAYIEVWLQHLTACRLHNIEYVVEAQRRLLPLLQCTTPDVLYTSSQCTSHLPVRRTYQEQSVAASEADSDSMPYTVIYPLDAIALCPSAGFPVYEARVSSWHRFFMPSAPSSTLCNHCTRPSRSTAWTCRDAMCVVSSYTRHA